MKIKKINLREIEFPDMKSSLDALINDKGDLIFDGCDSGERIKGIWDDFDYEYWIIVKSDFKDTLLLKLLKEKFESESKIREWLEENGIPFEGGSFA